MHVLSALSTLTTAHTTLFFTVLLFPLLLLLFSSALLFHFIFLSLLFLFLLLLLHTLTLLPFQRLSLTLTLHINTLILQVGVSSTHWWTMEKHPAVLYLQRAGVGHLHIVECLSVIENTPKINLSKGSIT